MSYTASRSTRLTRCVYSLLMLNVLIDVEQQEVIDTRGYDLRRRRRSPSADLDLWLPTVTIENQSTSIEDSSIMSPSQPEYEASPLRSPLSTFVADDNNAVVQALRDDSIFGRLNIHHHSSDIVHQSKVEGLERLVRPRRRRRQLMTSDQQVAVVARRVERSSWSDDDADVNDDDTRVEKFALEELTDRMRRVIDKWTTGDNEIQDERRHAVDSHIPFDVSNKHINNNHIEFSRT